MNISHNFNCLLLLKDKVMASPVVLTSHSSLENRSLRPTSPPPCRPTTLPPAVTSSVHVANFMASGSLYKRRKNTTGGYDSKVRYLFHLWLPPRWLLRCAERRWSGMWRIFQQKRDKGRTCRQPTHSSYFQFWPDQKHQWLKVDFSISQINRLEVICIREITALRNRSCPLTIGPTLATVGTFKEWSSVTEIFSSGVGLAKIHAEIAAFRIARVSASALIWIN